MKILRRYPESMVIKGEDYRFEKILKDDFFSVNVLYRNQAGRRYVLKLSDFRFILGLLFRPFAMLMSGHEYTIYRMVDGLPGVPELGPRWGCGATSMNSSKARPCTNWARTPNCRTTSLTVSAN